MGVAKTGQRLPEAELCRVSGEILEVIQLERLLAGRRVIVVGLPGAFTPVCTGKHLPELINHADRLKASGIDDIICIAPNSPWVVEAWAVRVDPENKLAFWSDGNFVFTRAAGLTTTAPSYFLGHCSKRYTMIVDNAVVEKLAVEPQIDAFGCTRPEHILQ